MTVISIFIDSNRFSILFQLPKKLSWETGVEALKDALKYEASVTRSIKKVIATCEADPVETGEKRNNEAVVENVNDYHVCPLSFSFIKFSYGKPKLNGSLSLFHSSLIIWPAFTWKSNTMVNATSPERSRHWTNWWRATDHWANFCSTKNSWTKYPQAVSIANEILHFLCHTSSWLIKKKLSSFFYSVLCVPLALVIPKTKQQQLNRLVV